MRASSHMSAAEAVVHLDGILAMAIVLMIFMLWARKRTLVWLNSWLDGPVGIAREEDYGSIWDGLPVASEVDDDSEDEECHALHSPAYKASPHACYASHRGQAIVAAAYALVGTMAAFAHRRVSLQAPDSGPALTAARLAVTAAFGLGYDAADVVCVPSFRWWLVNVLPLASMVVAALYATAVDGDAIDLPLVAPFVFVLGTSTARSGSCGDDNSPGDYAIAVVITVAAAVLASLQAAVLRCIVVSLIVAMLLVQIQRLLRRHRDIRPTTVAWLAAPPAALLVAAYAALYAPPADLRKLHIPLIALDVSLAAAMDLARLVVVASSSALAASMLDLLANGAAAISLALSFPGDHPHVTTLRWESIGVLLLACLAWALNNVLLKPKPPTPAKRGAFVVRFLDDAVADADADTSRVGPTGVASVITL